MGNCCLLPYAWFCQLSRCCAANYCFWNGCGSLKMCWNKYANVIEDLGIWTGNFLATKLVCNQRSLKSISLSQAGQASVYELGIPFPSPWYCTSSPKQGHCLYLLSLSLQCREWLGAQLMASPASFPICSWVKSSQCVPQRDEEMAGSGVQLPTTTTETRNGDSVKVKCFLVVATSYAKFILNRLTNLFAWALKTVNKTLRNILRCKSVLYKFINK